MASWLGSALGAIGSVAGGLFGANQARDDATTAYNRTRELDQWLGQNQIQWRVQDLEKAGLNKVLAAPGAFGGIGTQVAPSAQGGGSALSSGVSGAASAAAGMGLISAQTEAARAAASVSSAQAANIRNTTPTPDQFGRRYEAETYGATTSGGLGAINIAKAGAEIDNLQQQWKVLDQQFEAGKLSNEQAARMQDLIVKGAQLNNRLTEAQIPKAQAEAAAWNAVLAAAKKVGLDPAHPDQWTTAIDLAKQAPSNISELWNAFKRWTDAFRH